MTGLTNPASIISRRPERGRWPDPWAWRSETRSVTTHPKCRARITDEVARGAPGSWRRYLNFAESRTDPRSIFPAEAYDRLQRAKARYDPTSMFLANHAIWPPE